MKQETYRIIFWGSWFYFLIINLYYKIKSIIKVNKIIKEEIDLINSWTYYFHETQMDSFQLGNGLKFCNCTSNVDLELLMLPLEDKTLIGGDQHLI